MRHDEVPHGGTRNRAEGTLLKRISSRRTNWQDMVTTVGRVASKVGAGGGSHSEVTRRGTA